MTRMTYVSTKRIGPDGVVHEMADRGVGTMCGIELPEPWIWTAQRLSCDACRDANRKSGSEWKRRNP